MEDVGIFHGRLVYFTAIWYTFGTFGMFCGNLLYFSMFLYVVPRKIWQFCQKVSAYQGMPKNCLEFVNSSLLIKQELAKCCSGT
jgi:hypothetical protein